MISNISSGNFTGTMKVKELLYMYVCRLRDKFKQVVPK